MLKYNIHLLFRMWSISKAFEYILYCCVQKWNKIRHKSSLYSIYWVLLFFCFFLASHNCSSFDFFFFKKKKAVIGLVLFWHTEHVFGVFLHLQVAGCMGRHIGKGIKKTQELHDKIFADMTQLDVLLAHRETNMR